MNPSPIPTKNSPDSSAAVRPRNPNLAALAEDSKMKAQEHPLAWTAGSSPIPGKNFPLSVAADHLRILNLAAKVVMLARS